MQTIQLPPAAAIESAAAELGQNATITKALYDLAQRPQIVRISGAYLVPSSSRAGLVHRVDDVAGCSCEAGKNGRTCRHATAIALIEQAQTRVMPALAPLGDRISRARAEAAAARLALLECF